MGSTFASVFWKFAFRTAGERGICRDALIFDTPGEEAADDRVVVWAVAGVIPVSGLLSRARARCRRRLCVPAHDLAVNTVEIVDVAVVKPLTSVVEDVRGEGAVVARVVALLLGVEERFDSTVEIAGLL